MSPWLFLSNGVAVSLFGAVLSASFAGALHTPKQRWIFAGGMVLLLLIQGIAFALWDFALLPKIYPLTFHLPLLLLLLFLTRRVSWSLISILAAYLCCQLRRWLTLLLLAIFSGTAALQQGVELLLTLPLLFFLLYFFSPAVRPLSTCALKLQWQFGAIPVIYFAFDYLTRVYTDLLQKGSPVVVEFMPFVCCSAYFVFLLHHSTEMRIQSQLNQTQNHLRIQLNQSVREIQALRESQTLARQYRHDMRHHLQYLSARLENGQTEQARAYIAQLAQAIDAQKVQRYCENEAANLILSAFMERAARANVAMSINGTLPKSPVISDMDLCVLFSNALENALHACEPLVAAGKPCRIDVQFYEQKGRFFLQIINPTQKPVRFHNGIPLSDEPGHGIGVQSICTIVERYGGIHSFQVQDGQFILRLSL